MKPPFEMSGDYVDYVAAAEPTVEQKLADTQAQLVLMEQRHDHLFTAVEALSKSPELTQFAQQLVAAVLVDHLKGWKS